MFKSYAKDVNIAPVEKAAPTGPIKGETLPRVDGSASYQGHKMRT